MNARELSITLGIHSASGRLVLRIPKMQSELLLLLLVAGEPSRNGNFNTIWLQWEATWPSAKGHVGLGLCKASHWNRRMHCMVCGQRRHFWRSHHTLVMKKSRVRGSRVMFQFDPALKQEWWKREGSGGREEKRNCGFLLKSGNLWGLRFFSNASSSPSGISIFFKSSFSFLSFTFFWSRYHWISPQQEQTPGFFCLLF